MSKELLIFDLDGTLIDSSDDIVWAANMTLKEMGHETLDSEFIKSQIGWGIQSLLEKLLPEYSDALLEESRQSFIRHYLTHLTVTTAPYPGVIGTLEHLRAMGKRLTVITNKPIGPTEEILDALNMDGYFEVVLGGDNVPKKKPSPEPVFMMLERTGVSKNEAVFIGDSAVDCEASTRAGVDIIGAAYGFRGRQELLDAGCNSIIDDFTELKAIIG